MNINLTTSNVEALLNQSSRGDHVSQEGLEVIEKFYKDIGEKDHVFYVSDFYNIFGEMSFENACDEFNLDDNNYDTVSDALDDLSEAGVDTLGVTGSDTIVYFK